MKIGALLNNLQNFKIFGKKIKNFLLIFGLFFDTVLSLQKRCWDNVIKVYEAGFFLNPQKIF